MSKKILVFCGAFNPPTVAHLHAAQLSLEAAQADALVWVPSKTDYVSGVQKKSILLDDALKLKALSSMLFCENGSWRPGCENQYVSRFKLDSPVQPKTIETLRHFQKKYPNCRFILVMGSDKLPELENGWAEVDELLCSFGVITLQRGNDDVQSLILKNPFLSRYSDRICVISPGISEQILSATQVRKNIEEIRSLIKKTKEMVPSGTWEVVESTL